MDPGEYPVLFDHCDDDSLLPDQRRTWLLWFHVRGDFLRSRLLKPDPSEHSIDVIRDALCHSRSVTTGHLRFHTLGKLLPGNTFVCLRGLHLWHDLFQCSFNYVHFLPQGWI